MKAKSSSVKNIMNIQFQCSFMNIWVGCEAWVAVHCSSRNLIQIVQTEGRGSNSDTSVLHLVGAWFQS